MKHITIAIIATVAACTALLWSWNTLAELLGAPAVEFRHVVATLVIAVVARVAVTRRRHQTR